MPSRPQILLEEGILLPALFAQIGAVSFFADSLEEAQRGEFIEVLGIRSGTPFGRREMHRFPNLKILMTATAALDHVDMEMCQAHGIRVLDAAGHNAEAVADWVWTVIFHMARRSDKPLRGKSLGIVGFGNTGQAVARRAAAVGVNVLPHDPPRHRREGFPSRDWETLMDADILSFHVPLIRGGIDNTVGLFRSADRRDGQWVLNASRGEVVQWMPPKIADSGSLQCAADVFATEPRIIGDELAALSLATPHVAGNTFSAKLEASRVLFRKLAQIHSPAKAPISGVETGNVFELEERSLECKREMDPTECMTNLLEEATDLGRLSSTWQQQMAGVHDRGVGEEIFQTLRVSARRPAFQEVAIVSVDPLPEDWHRILTVFGFKLEVTPATRRVIRLSGCLPLYGP